MGKNRAGRGIETDESSGSRPAAGGFALSRRSFTTLAAGGLATLTLPRCARSGRSLPLPPASTLSHAPGPRTPVVIEGVRRGSGADATEQAVRRVSEAATDFSWLSRGDTVLVKPVCNSGNAYPATTDPVALGAMVRLLREKGAGRVVVGDMSGVEFVRFSPERVRGSTRMLMVNNGLARAAEDAGAEVRPFEEAGWDAFFASVPRARGAWSGAIWLPEILNQVDHVVLMPRCGRHLLAGATLGLKAGVGWWRHDSRLEYHRDAATFAEKTADAHTVPELLAKQRLVLTSATRVLTTFGPDKGYVYDPAIGLVMASTDVVAHDMVSLAWLLDGRADTPIEARDSRLEDPNTSGVMVNAANRVVTQWLGGISEILRVQTLERWDLNSVWDDRVLRRAFQNAGGVPNVELVSVDGHDSALPRERLSKATALPA